MAVIPKDDKVDSTLSLLYDGFTFISRRCDHYKSDIFEARIMGEKTLCMRGEEAARLFYDTDKFKREGAIPARIKKTLFGEGSIQTMDGEAHRRRKEMFLSLMKPDAIQELARRVERQWNACATEWEKRDNVVLFDEVQEILCRAVCGWCGVPLEEGEVRRRSVDFWSMVDAFGAVGPRHWRGRRARTRTEGWIGEIIQKIRNKEVEVPEKKPAYAVAHHRQLDDGLLDTKTAAVELINVIRPTIAISTYIVFAALALHRYPDEREKLQDDKGNYKELFVQEIRRFYPFAPMLGARARSEFEWNGYTFKEGQLALLDIYGTNHDDRLWAEPERFQPDRFRNWDEGLYDFIPQGGNNHEDGHRCAGEWITIETMKVALNQLARKMEYKVADDQDLGFSLSRMPTFPRSGVIIQNIHRQE